MKKMIAVCLILALCVGLWFFGYYNRKSNDNIPSKELMVTSCLNKGEDYATDQLKGYKNTQLMEVWGKPDGHLFGFWGDIWETNNTYNLIVYYDSNGIVEHVKVMNEDNKEETLDALSQEEQNDFDGNFKLQATVLEISNKYFIVEPVEGSSEFKNTEQILVPMENMAASPEPQLGDMLEIVYCGDILATQPAEPTEIQSIRVIEKAVE